MATINFRKYDEDNPQIWRAFVDFAFQAKAKGFQQYGAKSIIELIRWTTGVKGNDQFKINNNYAPDYARKMAEKFPHFKGFFRNRELRNGRTGSETKKQNEGSN